VCFSGDHHECEKLKVLIAAGGTGGHVFPALAVVQELMKRAPTSKMLFVGTRKGIEAALVPKAGFDITFISIFGMKRRLALSNFLLPFVGVRGLVQSFRLIQHFSPDIVFGTGGYVAGPVLLAAVLGRVPTVLHEQNARPGFTTKRLARWVSMMLLSYPQSRVFYRRKDNLRVTGNPTRIALHSMDRTKARLFFGLREDLDTVLVFGGSLGAHSINMALLEALDGLMADGTLQLLWQTGVTDYEDIKKKTSKYELRIKVLPFIDSMIDAYCTADVVLCRAGASTLAEITRLGIPAILVPYPYATGNHQELNARILLDEGAAIMILDRALTGEKVVRTIRDLLQDWGKRGRMIERCKALGYPQAASHIVGAMFELAGSHGRRHDARE
jgi:UDP-N-acetylglucosamine--N-acetylmuramyl-(pentapeptide) pyrophosphoryl-undecaprenol N-acetylglucosamine transferase